MKKGQQHTVETRKKMSESHTGKKHTPETCKKMSEIHTGKKHTAETCKKISETLIGHKMTEKTRRKISNTQIDKKSTAEYRRKISKMMSGTGNPMWKGGISFGKYCPLFNSKFKKQVRDDYHHVCFLCNRKEEKRAHDGAPCEFVILCRSCHTKTNQNREFWEDLIMHYLYPERYFMIDI